MRGAPANGGDRAGVAVGSHDLESFTSRVAKEVNQISSIPAARVKNAHSPSYAAAEKLVEQVNVDLAELFRERQFFAAPSARR